MHIKGLNECDTVNYKRTSMFIIFPSCSWKCEKECGIQGLCQNSSLAKVCSKEIPANDIIKKYMDNPLTHAIVMGGLEPFDEWSDLVALIYGFREKTDDDIVIYTGYKEEEIQKELKVLKQYKNIIIKFGRYIPNQEPHYDEVLGVKLASNNQYARRIS